MFANTYDAIWIIESDIETLSGHIRAGILAADEAQRWVGEAMENQDMSGEETTRLATMAQQAAAAKRALKQAQKELIVHHGDVTDIELVLGNGRDSAAS